MGSTTPCLAWVLAEYGVDKSQDRTLRLPTDDCIVGRSADANVRINASSVSKRHARLTVQGQQLHVEDLGSTNGTYVNGQQITSAILQEGDLLQFGNAPFRVCRSGESGSDATVEEGVIPWANTLLSFDRLLSDRIVTPYFQPIVRMARNEIIAYEVLARSSLDEFKNPALMFGVAERLGQEAALSELMRMEGLRIAAASPLHNARFFLNTHPAEVVNVRLLRSLETLRSQFPQTAVTIEVHEAAVTDWQSIKELRSVLESLDMQLSYDDFGAGQGRLLELCEAPPHVLKFDMQLIRDIDHAADARQDLVRSLVEVALDLGTIPLAEGIETQGEHDACLSLGFQLGQGYLYAKPAPISELQ